MNGKPGVLAELLNRWEARSRDALPADAMLINKHIRELTEARATVERLAEALEQSQAALRTAATFRYTRAAWARDIATPAIVAGDAALAAFRGDV